ncbi:hypothetical protein SAMN05444143_1324 [Flavobacterium succinicans]|uniref:Uncharacterized protein n=1 Tax=Flavobacterium succinicans TaxID=29536 RepID=A0A1I5AAN6_9FLAO|nr:hypothetical protein [Flavobacterium succinicans]SFN59506.1 hypothetical protein SAMN05444143_1324 [Flavobacterium succinicans]
MKIIIYTLLLNVSFIYSQNLKTDFDNFYRGKNEREKPKKYILFEKENSTKQKSEDKNVTYFYIEKERFVFNKERHKIDTCSIKILKKIKLENSGNLQEEEVNYFRKKVEEFKKKTNQKVPKSMPISRIHKYLKVYILEKMDNDKIIKYEVDWELSSF